MFGVFFTCLASFLLFNFFNVLLQTVIALENVCDHLYVKLNTWIYCQIVLFLFTCKIGDKWISNNQFEHVYLNLYIPSNLSRIKKVKVARLQTMRPSLVKLTALSGISPFTTNVCIDYWLCSTCSVTYTNTDLVELLERITFGWSQWWHGNLSLLSPYFMIKSQLYFLVRPNPHEAYIISSFFLSNLALSFYIPSSFRWCLPGLLSFL